MASAAAQTAASTEVLAAQELVSNANVRNDSGTCTNPMKWSSVLRRLPKSRSWNFHHSVLTTDRVWYHRASPECPYLSHKDDMASESTHCHITGIAAPGQNRDQKATQGILHRLRRAVRLGNPTRVHVHCIDWCIDLLPRGPAQPRLYQPIWRRLWERRAWIFEHLLRLELYRGNQFTALVSFTD